MGQKSLATKKRKFDKGASTSSAPPKPITDQSRFTDDDNAEWYELMRLHAMVVECTVDPKIDKEFQLKELFGTLGWQRILTLQGKYYPELVKEFYANVENKQKAKPTELVSTVRGKKVTICTSIIEEYLHLPSEGRQVNFHKGKVSDHQDWCFSDAKDQYELELRYSADLRRRMSAMFLSTVKNRLLAYILSRNVIPQSGKSSEIRAMDVYLMDLLNGKIQNMDPLRLSYTILQSISEVLRFRTKGKHFVFPILISRLLVKQGVSVRGMETRQTGKTDIVDVSKLDSLGFQKIHGLWERKPIHHKLRKDDFQAQGATQSDADLRNNERVFTAVQSVHTDLQVLRIEVQALRASQADNHAACMAQLKDIKDYLQQHLPPPN